MSCAILPIGNPDRALTSQTVFLEDVAAELSTPAKVTAGGVMQVIWQGPDYARDFIGIGKVGERYKRYSYTRDGSPLELKIPDEPGRIRSALLHACRQPGDCHGGGHG